MTIALMAEVDRLGLGVSTVVSTVLSNAGGAGVLAADACARYGLSLGALGEPTRDALAGLLPATAAVANPVDATATVPPETFGRVLELLLADPEVDAVLVISAATGVGDPLDGVGPVADRRPEKPVVAVRLGQAVGVQRLAPADPMSTWPDTSAVPAFADPAVAARALSAAVRRAAWLRRSADSVPVPRDVDGTRARAVAAAAMTEQPGGDWLDPGRTADLARAAGLPLVATTVVHTAEAAISCWRTIGGPVALKADVPGVLHKSRAGAVRTGLDSRQQLVGAAREFRDVFGARLRGITVQPMVAAGIELLVGVTNDPLCGPLLTLGLGGTSTDMVDDRTHCLVPATEDDLDELVDGLRSAPRLFGPDGPAGLRRAVRDIAARMAWLAAALPELAEAEINPLVVGVGAPIAIDVRVRLAPATPDDSWLRSLPT